MCINCQLSHSGFVVGNYNKSCVWKLIEQVDVNRNMELEQDQEVEGVLVDVNRNRIISRNMEPEQDYQPEHAATGTGCINMNHVDNELCASISHVFGN